MRQAIVAALAGVLVLFACSREWDDFHIASGTGGSDAGQVQPGSCFPPGKACPGSGDTLVCDDSDDPATGCATSTSCEPCALPHAAAKCAKGCVIAECDQGWSDCNNDPSDGCEANLEKDPTHCGDCATNCYVTSGATSICKGGACAANPCTPPTTGDCDGDPTNGCEVDLTSDESSCAFCGNSCQLPHATAACSAKPGGNPIARCVIQSCHLGWEDCDGKPGNGCEVSVAHDPAACGGCGRSCNATNGVPGCVNGACSLLCNPGFADCDGQLDNGCETNLSTHPAHCGACQHACSSSAGSPVCVAGKCTKGPCTSGYADCDGNPGNGCETAIESDAKNCGSCGLSCPGTANGFGVCTAASCGVGCSPGFSKCGAGTTCFDVTADPNHCGASCQTCAPPSGGNGTAACVGGVCTSTCAAGLSLCGSSCVDPKTSLLHCGACDKPCTAATGGTASCVNGQCVVTCPTGVALCGAQCVDIFKDGGNCGECGKKCGLGQACVSGTCACMGAMKNCGTYCAQCCTNADCAAGKKCVMGFCA